MCAPRSKLAYFHEYNRKAGLWTLVFVLGIVIGGYVGTNFLSQESIELLPSRYFELSGMVRLLVGGFLIGFGARYAGGCTSGHSITGISNLNWPSLVATVFFFVGGLAANWGLRLFISE